MGVKIESPRFVLEIFFFFLKNPVRFSEFKSRANLLTLIDFLQGWRYAL